jgi:hypothetical protein
LRLESEQRLTWPLYKLKRTLEFSVTIPRLTSGLFDNYTASKKVLHHFQELPKTCRMITSTLGWLSLLQSRKQSWDKGKWDLRSTRNAIYIIFLYKTLYYQRCSPFVANTKELKHCNVSSSHVTLPRREYPKHGSNSEVKIHFRHQTVVVWYNRHVHVFLRTSLLKCILSLSHFLIPTPGIGRVVSQQNLTLRH